MITPHHGHVRLHLEENSVHEFQRQHLANLAGVAPYPFRWLRTTASSRFRSRYGPGSTRPRGILVTRLTIPGMSLP